MPKKILTGIVVSDKADKTVMVKVESKVKHKKYLKIIVKHKKYAAHDSENKFKNGDKVKIIESKPLSKTKKWLVLSESIINN